jgi:hypothetical protein
MAAAAMSSSVPHCSVRGKATTLALCGSFWTPVIGNQQVTCLNMQGNAGVQPLLKRWMELRKRV